MAVAALLAAGALAFELDLSGFKDIDVKTHLPIESVPSVDNCPEVVMKSCPCDYLTFMQERCIEFGRHMNEAYPHEDHIRTVSVSARYYHNCLESTFTCELRHAVHGVQTLEYTLHAHPCERVAEIATRYAFKTKRELLLDPIERAARGEFKNDVFNRAERLREGEKRIVLSAPDHPGNKSDTTHFTEYMRVYFKDHMRKHPKTGEYFRGFHILFEVENDRADNSPPPTWRQISWHPEMQNCGKCHGGVGCMGGPTSAIIITALVASLLCIVVTCVLSCRRKALIPQV